MQLPVIPTKQCMGKLRTVIPHLDASDTELLRKALENLNAANGVVHFLSNHFREKYHLGPQHQITPTGEIVTVSGVGEKEKLNGTPTDGDSDSEPTRRDTISPVLPGVSS